MRRYRFYLALGGFTLLPLFSLEISTRSPGDYSFYDRWVIHLMAPIQNFLSWTFNEISWHFEQYLHLVHTQSMNKRLLLQNKELLKTLASYQEMQQENLRLQKLLLSKKDFDFPSIVARVIAKDVSTEFNSIRLDKGERDGLKKNFPVITADGVVGRIFRTTEKTSDVVTIVDLLSAIDAIAQRSRVQGIIEGKFGTTCHFKYVLRTDDVQIGDILISSGLGGIFPKGIRIGTVSQIQKKNYGITQEVEVQPSIDFSQLEEVLVLMPLGDAS